MEATEATAIDELVEQGWYALGLGLVEEGFMLPQMVTDANRGTLERCLRRALEGALGGKR